MNNEYVQWLDSHVEHWQSITNDEERLFHELQMSESEHEPIRMYIDRGLSPRAIFLIRENGVWKKLTDHFILVTVTTVGKDNPDFSPELPESKSNRKYKPLTLDQIDKMVSIRAWSEKLPAMAMWSYDEWETVCLRYYDMNHKPVIDTQQLSTIIKAIDIANDCLNICDDIKHSKVVLITSTQEVDEMRSEYIKNKYNH